MLHEIEIPSEVPVMTLSGAVLFPHAMMPLHIFEPRYCRMLEEVLEADRIFAVAALDESNHVEPEGEPPHAIAGVGMVRACRANDDGTSNLILQGLARVQIQSIVSESPFRRVRIRQWTSLRGADAEALDSIPRRLLDLIRSQMRLGAPIPNEVTSFLENVEEPENVLDLSIHTLCSSADLKQRLLETREVMARFHRFEAFMRAELEKLQLERQLRGGLDDEDIENN